MAFNFQAYRNPYVSTIAELLSRGEDAKAKALVDVANAQARAAEARGQAFGGAVQNIGQIASKALTDYTDPKRKLNDMALKQAESNARLDDATRDVLSQTMRPVITTAVPGVPFEASSVNVVPPTPQGMGSRAFGGVSFGAPVQPQASEPLFGRTEVGTQTVVPDSTFVQSQGPERPRFNDPSTGLFDINEVGKAFANLKDKDGRPFSPAQIASRLEPIQKINESVLDFDAKQDLLEKSKQVAFGTMADGVIKYVEANGGSYIDAARLAVTPWERRLGKDAVDTFLENFRKLSPTQQRGQLDVFRNQAASLLPQKTLAKDSIEVNAFGQEIARGPVGQLANPTRASLLRDANDPTKTTEERAIAQKIADDLKPEGTLPQSSPRRVRITLPNGKTDEITANYVPGRGQSGKYFVGETNIDSLNPQLIEPSGNTTMVDLALQQAGGNVEDALKILQAPLQVTDEFGNIKYVAKSDAVGGPEIKRTPAQQTRIAALDKAIADIDAILEMADDPNVWPDAKKGVGAFGVGATKSAAKNYLNVGSDIQATFRNRVNALRASTAFGEGGKSLTKTEQEMMAPFNASIGINPDVGILRLRDMRKRLASGRSVMGVGQQPAVVPIQKQVEIDMDNRSPNFGKPVIR